MTVPSWIMTTATIGWLSGEKITDLRILKKVLKQDVTPAVMVVVRVHHCV